MVFECASVVYGTQRPIQISETTEAMIRYMHRNGFQYGHGLGANLQGETESRTVALQRNTIGLGYVPTKRGHRNTANQMRGTSRNKQVPYLNKNFISTGFMCFATEATLAKDSPGTASSNASEISSSSESEDLSQLFSELQVATIGPPTETADLQGTICPASPGERIDNWSSSAISQARVFW